MTIYMIYPLSDTWIAWTLDPSMIFVQVRCGSMVSPTPFVAGRFSTTATAQLGTQSKDKHRFWNESYHLLSWRGHRFGICFGPLLHGLFWASR